MRLNRARILTAAALLCLLTAVPSMAAPVAVTLFPDGGLLEERISVNIQSDPSGPTAVFTLPPQAQPETLTVLARGAEVADVVWRQVPAVDEARVASLRAELEKLRERHAAVQGDSQAADARIGFWKAQGDRPGAAAAELRALSAAMGESLGVLHREKASLEKQSRKLEAEIQSATDRLKELTGGGNTRWEIRAVLGETAESSAELVCSYRVGGCGWRPAYRLEALPRDGKIRFGYSASVWQSTGSDWQDIPVRLATVDSRGALEPPRLGAWLIRPFPRPVVMRKGAAPAMMADSVTMEAAGAAAPAENRRAAFAVWDLGSRNVPAGPPRRLALTSEVWDAEFFHTLRPSTGDKAYITAKVELDRARELPPGECLYLLDGAILGKRRFRLAGKDAEMFFGTDPLVTVKTELLEQQTGEKGFIGKKQSFSWNWRFTVRNDNAFAVTARLEEPNPQSRDKDIGISIESSPTADTTDPFTLAWPLELSPGEETVITHSVSAEAPEDMPVDPGR